jgi:DNA-binding response OmpR family regulator
MSEAARLKPNLIMLDLGLPDRDGVEFIRDYRGWSATPILIISARTEEKGKVEALDAGADDYLTKPFGVAELLARVRALLRRAPGKDGKDDQGEPVITFGDYRIDCIARTLTRNGEPIKLSQIEYRLLLAMAGNPDRVGRPGSRQQRVSARLRRPPAPEDRSQSGAAAPYSDRDRRWLPLSALTPALTGIQFTQPLFPSTTHLHRQPCTSSSVSSRYPTARISACIR